ncbi:C40 family peptidase [Luedemannella helvata]|uniref:C40 family peptidase n=1 Tax=Luedemannella helvata TaxID=349315 RepID=UPI0031CFC466
MATLVIGFPSAGHADPPVADQLEAASHRLEKVVERYNATRADLAATRARMRVIARQLRPLDRRLDAAQSRVGRIAASAYKDGGLVTAGALLSATSPHALVDRLLALDHLARTERRDVRALDALDARLRSRQRDLTGLATRLAKQRRELAADKAEVIAEITRLEGLRAAARQADWGAPVTNLGSDPVSVQERALTSKGARSAVSYALDQRGKDYQFGSSGPNAFDCSGLAMASWRRAGVYLPHNAARMWWSVPHLNRSDLRPGDLVFYYSDIHHVAVYIGSGRVVHAPGWGQPVTISPLHHAPVYGYGRPG